MGKKHKMLGDGITCPKCGYFYKGHTNVWGKVCQKCGAVIKPDKKPTFIEEREKDLIVAQEQIRRCLKNKLNRRGHGNTG